MNLNSLPTPKIINLHAHQFNRDKALSHAHSALMKCSPGEVVCITDPTPPKKGRVINRIKSLLQRNNEEKNNHLMPVVNISATTSIKDGILSAKALTLETLNTIRPTLYSRKKMHRVPEVSLQIALEQTLVSRKTKYVLITNAHKAFNANSQKINPLNILNKWKFLAQSAGVVIVFDLMENTSYDSNHLDNKGE